MNDPQKAKGPSPSGMMALRLPTFESGYIIQLSGTAYGGAPATCNGLGAGDAAQAYKAGADPAEPTNWRFFAINASGTIYEDSSSLYAAMPEVGEPASGHVYR